MTEHTSTPSRRDRRACQGAAALAGPQPMWRRGASWMWATVAVLAAGALFLTVQTAGRANTVAAAGEGYAVGIPGPGRPAPDLRLASTGGDVDLADRRGRSVLLHVQKGIGCHRAGTRSATWRRTPRVRPQASTSEPL